MTYCRITNAVNTSGVLKERLFKAAYNSKKQAVMNGIVNIAQPEVSSFCFPPRDLANNCYNI